MSNTEKKALRREAADRRAELFSRAHNAGNALRDNFLRAIALPPPAAGQAPWAIAGFWPFDEEIDTRPLLVHLHDAGYRCCLPVVAGKSRPLQFRRWTPETRLVPDAFGVSVPPPDAPPVTPNLLIVPLLAFDRGGWRLGYGAGFYDYTLNALRKNGRPLAVGVGFAGQEVPAVPHDDYDARVDWIVTEREAIRVTEA